jgi:hypothetical protein
MAALLLAVGPAAQAAAQQDLRTPDARDAAIASQAQSSGDLRTPDARDAALASEARAYVDLRSPDARDAGEAPSPPSSTPSVTADGTSWDEIGIVAGSVLLAIGLGALALFGRRRLAARRARTAVAPG